MIRSRVTLLCVCLAFGCKALNPAFEMGETDAGESRGMTSAGDGTTTTDPSTMTTSPTGTPPPTVTTPPTTTDPPTVTTPPTVTQGMSDSTVGPSSESDETATETEGMVELCATDEEACDPLDLVTCERGRICRPVRAVAEPHYVTTVCAAAIGEDGRAVDAIGENCSRPCGEAHGVDTCESSAVCDPLVEDAGGPTCIELCNFDGDCENNQHACVPHGVGGGDYEFGLCRARCDAQGEGLPCPAGFECIYTGLDDNAACIPTELFEPPPAGFPCDANRRCGPRAVCIEGPQVPDCDGDWCCAQTCETDNCGPEPSLCASSDAYGGPSSNISACIPFS